MNLSSESALEASIQRISAHTLMFIYQVDSFLENANITGPVFEEVD